MATSVPGIAGIVQQQDSGLDLTGLAQMITGLKKQKQDQAVQNLQQTMQLAQQGLVDGATLEKAVNEWSKASGIKLDLSKGGQVDQKQGSAIQAVGKAGEQPSGAQSATPVSLSSAKAYPAGGQQPEMQGANMYENYITQIKKQIAAKGVADVAKSEYEANLNQMQSAALQGDQQAHEMLQKAGITAYNADLERKLELKTSNPEEYKKEQNALHEQAMGMETPAQKELRKNNFVTSLIAEGYTPEQAVQEFDKPGSSGVKKSIKQLASEASYFHDLQESFGDEVAAKVAPQLAAGASLSDVLPNVGKYQSHFAQQMAETRKQHEETLALQKEELGVRRGEAATAKERLDFDKSMGRERFDNLSEKISLELMKAENMDFSARMSDLISAQKAGVKIPDEVLGSYMDQLASKVGLTKNDAKQWWNWMTPAYTRDLTAEKGFLDQFTKPKMPEISRTGKPQAKSKAQGIKEDMTNQQGYNRELGQFFQGVLGMGGGK